MDTHQIIFDLLDLLRSVIHLPHGKHLRLSFINLIRISQWITSISAIDNILSNHGRNDLCPRTIFNALQVQLNQQLQCYLMLKHSFYRWTVSIHGIRFTFFIYVTRPNTSPQNKTPIPSCMGWHGIWVPVNFGGQGAVIHRELDHTHASRIHRQPCFLMFYAAQIPLLVFLHDVLSILLQLGSKANKT